MMSNNVWTRCRCCYSSENLGTLCGPVLNAYKFVSNSQNLENDNTEIVACIRCYEFLEELHRFKNKFFVVDEIFQYNLDVKHFDVESMLGNVIDKDSSQITSSTRCDEIDQVELHIKVEENLNLEKIIPEDLPASAIETFPNEENLIEVTQKRFECNDCTFNCKKKHLMVAHQIIHDKTNFIISIQRYDNPECKNNEKVHLKDSDQLYECIKCSYTTDVKGRLKCHIMFKHNEVKPYHCEYCDYRSKTKNQIIMHTLRRHSSNHDVLQCTECSYRSTFQNNMKQHMAVHVEHPFSCDKCNYRCKFKHDLSMHKMIHLKDNDHLHKCTECSYITKSKRSLKSHFIHKHTDNKPFSCDSCNYRSKTKNEITMHIHRKHSNKQSTLYSYKKMTAKL